MSSRLPRGAVSDHGVEDGEELPHAGHQGDLGWLPLLPQVLVEGPYSVVSPYSRQHAHVQYTPHMCSSSPHGSLSLPHTTVAVERRYPD